MDDVEYASMTEARKKHLAGLHKEGKRLGKECLTVSEIEEVIRETALSPTDRRIATMRYVRCLTASEIAGALSYDERTVRRRVSSISGRLCLTLLRIIHA